MMSFASVPLIADDKNKSECIFRLIIMSKGFYVEPATKKKMILPSNSTILINLFFGNVYNPT